MYNQQSSHFINRIISFIVKEEVIDIIFPLGSDILQKEEWKYVNSFFKNVKPCYMVSSWGRIYNEETYNHLPKDIHYSKDKYINISMGTVDGGRFQIMLQRLVMYLFAYIPGCDNLDVNHKDGIKYHNWIWNLEWCTHKENMDHAYNNNLFKFGLDRINSKLTDMQVMDLCLLIEKGYGGTEIAKIYPIESINVRRTVQNIKNGHCRKNISKNYDFDFINKMKDSTTIESKIIKPIIFIE